MGWTYYHKPSHVKPLDAIRVELLSPDYLTKNDYKIEGEAKVGKACYFAVSRPAKDHEPIYIAVDGRVTTCVVVLVSSSRDYHNFGYKDMDETAGPCECDCPERILKLLSPLHPVTGSTPDSSLKWATDFRARCRAKRETKAKSLKLTDGLKVRLSTPLKFSNGATVEMFTVRKFPRRGRMQTVFEFNGIYYRISGEHRAQLIAA